MNDNDILETKFFLPANGETKALKDFTRDELLNMVINLAHGVRAMDKHWRESSSIQTWIRGEKP